MTGMQAGDIALTAVAGDVRVSPDGGRVLYTLTTVDLDANSYRTRVWIADVDGGGPRPLTAGVGTDVLPRWSPDGRMLAWVSSTGGGRPTILVQFVDGPGTPVPLATWSDDIGALEWSPSGDRLAFVGRRTSVARNGRLGPRRGRHASPTRHPAALAAQRRRLGLRPSPTGPRRAPRRCLPAAAAHRRSARRLLGAPADNAPPRRACHRPTSTR